MRGLFVTVVFITAMLALAVGLLRIVDRIRDWRRRDRRTPVQRAADEAAYRTRLLNPRWDEVEQLTGGRPSPALVALYSDHDLILRTDLCVTVRSAEDTSSEEFLSRFQPADAETFSDEWCRYLPTGAFPFAQDITGDLVFVELTPEGEDRPVRHWYHDGGDIESVATSLASFHATCSRAKRKAASEVPPN